MERNFFLGIDLGTTNSVISYLNTKDGKLIPTVLEVPRISDTQGSTSAKTLPSFVYYKKDAHGHWAPYVGDFAKAQFGKRYGYVVKSVKSSMGQGEIPALSAELADRLPEDVSAEILRQMLTGAKKKLLLDEQPRDVIITIPASFDDDMRKALLGTVSVATGRSKKQSKSGAKPIMAADTAGMTVHFRAEINTLGQMCEKRRRALKSGNQQSIATANKQVTEVMHRLQTAVNGADSGKEIVDTLFNAKNTYFINRLLKLGAHFYPLWGAQEQHEFHKICRRYLGDAVEQARMSMTQRDYHTQAINAVAVIGDEKDIAPLELLLAEWDRSYSPLAAITLAKLRSDPAPIIECLDNMRTFDTAQLSGYAWAIGKICSREVGRYDDLKQMGRATLRLCKLIEEKEQKNVNVVSLLAYAIGELCDCRAGVMRPLPEKTLARARDALKTAKNNLLYNYAPESASAQRKVDMALHMAEGAALSAAEDAQLLALRSDTAAG